MKGRADGFKSSCLSSSCRRRCSHRRRPKTNASRAPAIASAATPPTTPPTIAPTFVPPPPLLPPLLLLLLGSPLAGAPPAGAGAGTGAAAAAPPPPPLPAGGLRSASASISSAGGRAAAWTGSQVELRLMGMRRQVRSRSSHTVERNGSGRTRKLAKAKVASAVNGAQIDGDAQAGQVPVAAHCKDDVRGKESRFEEGAG